MGLRMLEYAALAPRGHGLRAIALPYMEDLHRATQQHVQLAVRENDEGIIIERLSAPGAGKVLSYVGGRVPLHGTGLGLILLAHSRTEFQESYLQRELFLEPEHTPLPASTLRSQLQSVRALGVAHMTRSLPEPATSVGAPIFDRSGRVRRRDLGSRCRRMARHADAGACGGRDRPSDLPRSEARRTLRTPFQSMEGSLGAMRGRGYTGRQANLTRTPHDSRKSTMTANRNRRRPITRPVFHHTTFATLKLDEMVEFYEAVAGLEPVYHGTDGAWLTNDEANHRIALLALPDLKAPVDKGHTAGPAPHRVRVRRLPPPGSTTTSASPSAASARSSTSTTA